MIQIPTIQHIRQAHERIKPLIHYTPVMTCRALNQLCAAELFFKCENLQKVGAFKIRGAANAVLSLDDEQAARGVATHSSGNHGAALALAARWRNIPAYVVMPENAPSVKKNAVAGYGAEIVFCQPTLQARQATLETVTARTGAAFVHPSNDFAVIAGQGTAALELCAQVPDLDLIMAPVGGGGLISGTAIAAAALTPHISVVAAEPEAADDAYRSFRAGRIIPVDHPQTIADGLRTLLGERTFAAITQYVADIVTVSEGAIVQAMRHIWERMKLIVEPSSAVPLGALLPPPQPFAGKRIGIILSGGNVDLDHLPWEKG